MSQFRVALCKDCTAAEQIRDGLLQTGIPARIHDEPWQARLWFVSERSAGIRVEVPSRMAETALVFLRAWDAADGALRAAIRCPECNSTLVDYPQFAAKFVLPNLVFGLIAALGLLDKEYYCERCHYMWPKATVAPARVRARQASDYFVRRAALRNLALTVESQVTRFPGMVVVREPSRKHIPRATKPSCSHRFGKARKVLMLAGSLLGVALLSESTAGLGASANPGILRDSGTKTAVNSNMVDGKQNPESPTYLRDVLPVLMGKCSRCHGDQSGTMQNWLDYKTAFSDRWEMKRRIWNSWKEAYYKQPMPTGNSPEGHSMTEAERVVIRDWVDKGAPLGLQPTYTGIESKAEIIEHGKQLYSTICAACHQTTGQGISARFPPLAGSDFLNADKHRAIKIVINGLQGEVKVNGQTFNNSMPKLPLTDHDIAHVLTFVYSSFGNSGKEVMPQEVSAVRAEKDAVALNQPNGKTPPQQKTEWE